MDTISQNKNAVTSFIDALFTKGDFGANTPSAGPARPVCRSAFRLYGVDSDTGGGAEVTDRFAGASRAPRAWCEDPRAAFGDGLPRRGAEEEFLLVEPETGWSMAVARTVLEASRPMARANLEGEPGGGCWEDDRHVGRVNALVAEQACGHILPRIDRGLTKWPSRSRKA